MCTYCTPMFCPPQSNSKQDQDKRSTPKANDFKSSRQRQDSLSLKYALHFTPKKNIWVVSNIISFTQVDHHTWLQRLMKQKIYLMDRQRNKLLFCQWRGCFVLNMYCCNYKTSCSKSVFACDVCPCIDKAECNRTTTERWISSFAKDSCHEHCLEDQILFKNYLHTKHIAHQTTIMII